MDKFSAPKCKTLQHIRKYQNQNNGYTDETNDPYYWLTDKSNPEVIDYLEAENKYTADIMSDTKQLQDQLFHEFKAKILESDTTAPWPHDNYEYYFRTIEGQDYYLFCRKKIGTDSTEQILLDENILAKDHYFFSTGDIEVSPCHKYLAYTADFVGNECYGLYIKDLANNKTFELNIKNISAELEWSSDSKSIIYLTLDDSMRPYQINCFQLNEYLASYTESSFTLYTESDERFWVGIERTRTQKYLLITAQSKLSTEIYFLPAANLSKTSIDKIKSIKTREQNIEYSVEHYCENINNPQPDLFYILINSKQKPNYELYKLDLNKADTINNFKNWELILAHNSSITLEHIDSFRDYCILFTRTNGLNQLNIAYNYDFTNIQRYNIEKELGENIYDLGPATNEMFDSNKYRWQFESLSTPHSVYSLEINKNSSKLELVKQDSVLGGYNKSDYKSERVFCQPDPSNPNLKVPISIVYNKHKYKADGKHPLLLYGYGSYGICIDPYFSYSRLSLLDRGIAFAIAHIRGGSELGETWHHQGRLNEKTNTFTDFIASAEYLIKNKFTSSNRLIIQGGSAGGLLIGNVINQRPELFHSAIAEVPFVDCLNAMLDPELPLTITEYEEWGNPTAYVEVYEYMKSYTPYENIKHQAYPNLLINNNLEDVRVSYWEAAKWTAKLRANKTDNNLLLLKTEMTAGHAGASGRYQSLKDAAFNYSFILKTLEQTDS